MARKVQRDIDDLNRAFAQAGAEFRRDRDKSLRLIAAPVARDAESLARTRIRNLGKGQESRQWGDFRVGVLTDSVYVAPVKRGTRIHSRKRSKFAGLLMGQAMRPALSDNAARIETAFDQLLARMETRFRSG